MTHPLPKIFGATALAAAAMLTFITPAAAQERTKRSTNVVIADLDLASANGRATLDGRIKGAVLKVCGNYGYRDLVAMQDYNRCVDEAKASAENAKLTAIANADQQVASLDLR